MLTKNTPVFLTQLQEEQLIENWQESYKLKDSKELLLAFRPLILNVVKKYRHYGIVREDLIQEAWLGLCIALCKYDSSRGVRFSSYARWWVNASCQDYVMRNWSIVRVGTTTTHKKLFFQLRYLKRSLEKIDTQYFEPHIANTIANNLQISVREVQAMHDKLIQKDKCLDQKIHADYEVTFTDMLVDESELIDSILIDEEEQNSYSAMFSRFHEFLDTRELDILIKRRIKEPPQTLEDISICYGITKERVRQIEKHAIRKLRKSLVFAGIKHLDL